MHHINPKDIRFSQPNVGTHFSDGSRVDGLINDLRSGSVSPYDIHPIQVVQKDGALYSLDNRRLLAFNSAGIEKVPIEIVSINDPAIAIKFRDRFDPILGQGHYAIVVNRTGRANALSLLEEYGMIKGVKYGH